MSVQIEKLENSMVKMTIEATAEEFESALQKSYLKNRKSIALPGFRKGKAPRPMIEKAYGVGIFYEDAANELIPALYAKAADESGLEIMSQPDIDVTQIEKGQPFVFTATFAVKPEVTLGDYKGLKVLKRKAAVTAAEVEAELKRVQEQNSREVSVEDRPVADGDTAIIDFEGFVDGVAFEGGKGENHSLVIGSHSFIDTFEEQLIGHAIGEEVEVNVTFPAEYHSADLAGKAAMFQVKINAIKVKELPELDDDFASDVSEFDTLAEYKDSIKKDLTERKEKANKTDIENELVDLAVENAAMDMPEVIVDGQARNMLNEFAQRLQYQGMKIEDYMKYTGMTAEAMMAEMRPQAEKRVRTRLVLEAIAAAEGIEVTAEDLEKEFETMAATYKMEVAKIKELLGEDEVSSMKKDLAVQKAIDLLVAEAKLVAKKAKTKTAEKTAE